MTVKLQFQVHEQIDPPALIFELEGMIDNERSFEKLSHHLDGSDKKHHILDLSKIRYVNSCGFSELILLHDSTKRSGKTVYFVNLSKKVHDVIIPLGGEQVLTICKTEEVALEEIEKALA